MKINVVAKITAGVHPKYGAIIEGQTYTIDEQDFGDQLFDRPEDKPAVAEPKPRRK